MGMDITPYSIDVLPSHNKVILGDTVRTVLLCSYSLDKRTLIPLSYVGLATLSLEATFLGNYITQTDTNNNIFLLSGRLDC